MWSRRCSFFCRKQVRGNIVFYVDVRHQTKFAIIFTQFCWSTVVISLWSPDTFDNVCVHPSHDLQTHLTHIYNMCSSHDLQTLSTVFVSIHLMTCRRFWQCLCPSISWPADAFDNVCVHPSHDLQTHLTVCLSISWPAHFWQFVFIHLMTCRHFWQCLCPSILWHADIFDSVCVHPFYDLQTLLTVFVSIHFMTCRHFWQWFYVHPSHDIQTLFKVGLTVTW